MATFYELLSARAPVGAVASVPVDAVALSAMSKGVELQKAVDDVAAANAGEKVVDQEEEERIARANFVPSHGLTTAGTAR